MGRSDVKRTSVHEFQVSRTGACAWCSCKRWTLWGASPESARRSHGFHRANLPEVACVGRQGRSERLAPECEAL